MKTLLILAVLLSSCTAMYFPTSSGYKNSIYYTSTDEVAIDTESYESRIHKFDAPTYTIELNLTHYYWSWRMHDYWGYYNPYRYYPYRSYWDWHRPYYTYHHKPSYRHRDVYYTRRGGMRGSTPTHRTSTTSRPKVHANEGNRHTNRGNYSRSTVQPTRSATVSRKTNVRYNYSKPVSRSQSQADRTGYSRSTTNRSSNTGRTYYNNGPSQRTQPSVRYNERNTSSYSNGTSRNQSSGSTTRRK